MRAPLLTPMRDGLFRPKRCPAIVFQNFAGQLREASTGNAHAQKSAEKSLLERGIILQRIHNRPNFLLRFRRRNAPDTIQVAAKKTRPQAIDEKRHRLNFRMHRIPKNAFLKAFLRVFKPRAKGGFKIVRRDHGFGGFGWAIYFIRFVWVACRRGWTAACLAPSGNPASESQACNSERVVTQLSCRRSMTEMANPFLLRNY